MEFPLFFIACCGAAATGAMFPPGPWYDELDKPGFTPPNWLFPIAWTVIYLAISWAAARIAATPDPGLPLALWAVQIAFNTLWTPVFFGLRRMKAAMIVIGALWLAVAATTLAFWQRDALAGLLFAPYLVWVSYAAALNFVFMRRNPSYAT